jgi:predicted secreted protein
MKKLYVFCSIVIVTLLSLSACQVREGETQIVTTVGPTTTITITGPTTTIAETSWLIIDTYFDVDEEIVTGVGKEFAIALYSVQRFNMYRWDVIYDEDMVALSERTWKYYEGQFIADEGKEWFIFKTLKEGTTEITLTYIRSGFPSSSESVVEQKVFKIKINILPGGPPRTSPAE